MVRSGKYRSKNKHQKDMYLKKNIELHAKKLLIVLILVKPSRKT